MIYGYVRVSTAEQSADSQKSLIARYVVDRRWTVDEWMEQGRLCGGNVLPQVNRATAADGAG